MTTCGAIRPDCQERFRSMQRAADEQDASLRDLAEKMDGLPDRIVGQVMQALGAQTTRNADDIQTIFKLIGDLQQTNAMLQRDIAALQGQGVGMGWTLKLGLPLASGLISAAASIGGALALVKL